MNSMKYYQENQLICWFPEGSIDKDIIHAYYSVLHDCVWANTANRFCDFSKVTSFAVSSDDLYSLSEFRKYSLKNHKNIILVMNSTRPLGYGMSRMYEGLMNEWEMNIYVTRTITEAATKLLVEQKLLVDP